MEGGENHLALIAQKFPLGSRDRFGDFIVVELVIIAPLLVQRRIVLPCLTALVVIAYLRVAVLSDRGAVHRVCSRRDSLRL